MTQTPNSAQDLFEALSPIKLAGDRCRYSQEYCEEQWPIIEAIRELKKEKNAIILAHSYVNPDILISVADFVGDSYELSKFAKQSDADSIVFSAVRFMGETAKILSPHKTVITPSPIDGCSLADSITAEDMKRLRNEYPDYAFVCYINTSADVKAHCDVCVTSSNASQIIQALPQDKIYFLPDKLMGENIKNDLKAAGSTKTLEYYDGTCYVHEEYEPEMIDFIRLNHPHVKVAAHPECAPDIVEKSDFVGSTSQLIKHVKSSDDKEFFLLTECGLSARLQTEVPGKRFLGSCTMCKYMKSNTLSQIHQALSNPRPESIIQLDERCIQDAKHCIDQMFVYAEKAYART